MRPSTARSSRFHTQQLPQGSQPSLSWRGCSAGLLGLLLGACSGAPPSGPDPDDSPALPAALVSASVVHQTGVVGGAMTLPFAVKVLDAAGIGVPNVPVLWETTAGDGAICFPDPSMCHVGRWPVLTDQDGISRIWHRPLQPGPGAVRALVEGLPVPPISFTVEGVGILIQFWNFWDCTGLDDPVQFRGPLGSIQITVPVGVPVEWEWALWTHPTCLARIVSTAVPPGGVHFDSGNLSPGQRFQFTPGVAGTWAFRDQFSGGTGTFTAIAPDGSSR